MTTRHLTATALLLLTSCGWAESVDPPAVAYADEPASSRRYWGTRAEDAPDPTPFESDLHGRYRVAPDRALVRVRIAARGPSRPEVARRARDAANELVEALRLEGRCAAEVVDFGTPRRDGDAWHERAAVRFEIALGDLDTVAERFTRVEQCMARFGSLGGSLDEVRLRVSDPLVTIDAPDEHRAALLARELGALEEVAAVTGPAAYDPSSMRCVSRGQVTVLERSLRGVALGIDFSCQAREGTPPPPAPTL